MTDFRSQIFWCQRSDARRHVPCLFLDRDGVLVEEVGYLGRPEDVTVLPGAVALIEEARRRGWAVGVVTNQAGVGRGFYDWPAFAAVQQRLVECLAVGPEPFDFVAACGAHSDARIDSLRIVDHPWRKPNPGMLAMAQAALMIDMPASVMIGDQPTDLEAGLAAGVGRVVHVLSGHGAKGRDAACDLAERHGSDRVILVGDLRDTLSGLGWSP